MTIIYFLDSDEDGFGEDLETIEACELPEGYAVRGGDCDDNNDTIYVGAPEQCDNLDNDCNEIIDDDLTELWYADFDEDGFGNIDDGIDSCLHPISMLPMPMIVMIAISRLSRCRRNFDEIDNDCDELIDEDVQQTFFLDHDNDGYGDLNLTIEACEIPEEYSDVSGDCDDNDSGPIPVQKNIADAVDNNCDGLIDDASSIDASIWYADLDADLLVIPPVHYLRAMLLPITLLTTRIAMMEMDRSIRAHWNSAMEKSMIAVRRSTHR